MKKTLLLVLTFTVFQFSVFSSNHKTSKTDTEKYSYSQLTGQFYPVSIEVFKYNQAIFDLYKSANSETDSIPESLTEFEYTGNVVSGTMSSWNNSKWNEQVKFITYLRGEASIDSAILFSYDSISQGWQPQTKSLYLFEGELNTKDQVYIADSLTGAWILYMESDYTYNSSGYLINEQLNVYDSESEQWTPIFKDDYYLSESGVTDSMINSMWIAGDDSWMALNKTAYFYNVDGDPEYDIDYYWGYITPEWTKSSKSTYLLNASGNVYFEEYLYWDDQTTDWAPSTTYTIIYSDESKPLIEEYREWIPAMEEYIVEEKSFYAYDTPQPALTNLVERNFSVFPNPASDFITVKVKQPQNANIQLFDMSGKIIFNQDLNTETSTISVAHLKKGNYLAKISNNRETNSQVLIVK